MNGTRIESRWVNPRALILSAPLLFCAHIAEEAPRFMRWYNTLVPTPVSETGFIQVQVPYFVITTVLAVAAAWFQRKETGFLLVVWLSFVMFANAVFHVTATLVLRRYCPGLITALILYVPFFFWYTRYLRTRMAVGAVSIGLFCALSTGIVYAQWHKLVLGN